MSESANKSDLDYIFRPKSIAVIGATVKEYTIGRAILHNMIINEFKGKIFPVNPHAQVIQCLKCYPDVEAIPDPVDLAVIMVKKELVAETLEQCGRKNVKGAVVITSGFREIGGKGIEEEERLIKIINKYGMRMVGPNCFGIINTDPQISINATFSKTRPRQGKVAFISQSGALGEAILDYAYQLKLGFSIFVSMGNKANISGADMLEYLENDPRTELILLYLENFKNPRRFAEIARRVAHKKPIIAIKAGRTSAGAKAISSHTGVLATPDVGVDAMFRQCGVIRVDTVDELFDYTLAFVSQPLPKSNRVAIITNAGGPGIMATDAAVGAGLEVAPLTADTTAYLRAHLPDMAAVGNPIDVIASGGPDAYGAALNAVFRDPNIDSIICIFVPPIVVDHRAVINAIAETVDRFNNCKTFLACFMNMPEIIAGHEELANRHIPIYTFPEAAARALAGLFKCAQYRNRPDGALKTFEVDRETAMAVVKSAIAAGRKAIMGGEAIAILRAYGINVAPTAKAKTAVELAKLSSEIGYPQVIKLDDPEVIHKTDVGGVVLDINSLEEAKKAFARLEAAFTRNGVFAGVIIQKMIKGGIETIIGMNCDPYFGPLLMFGLGGISVEVMKDVAFMMYPLTDRDAAEMIRQIKGYPLLFGFRGAAPVDHARLEETLLRLSQLVGDFPEFESLDINPFIAGTRPENSLAIDARIILK